jgi:hypothetical protein
LRYEKGKSWPFNSSEFTVKQNGHATLTITLPNGKKENYLITLRESRHIHFNHPCNATDLSWHVTATSVAKLQIQGLIWGSPYIELADSTAISSDTGYVATIDYKGKGESALTALPCIDLWPWADPWRHHLGWVSGKAHSYKATLTHNGKSVKSYEGTWTGIGKVHKTEEVFTDSTVPKTEVSVKPIEEQGEWESRRLWSKVANGIRTGDYDAASRDKSRIEVSLSQRAALRKSAPADACV